MIATMMTATIDPHSPTWAAVTGWIAVERRAVLAALVSPATDWDTTQVLRGRLQTLDTLATLAAPAPLPRTEPETYGL